MCQCTVYIHVHVHCSYVQCVHQVMFLTNIFMVESCEPLSRILGSFGWKLSLLTARKCSFSKTRAGESEDEREEEREREGKGGREDDREGEREGEIGQKGREGRVKNRGTEMERK